MGSRSGKLVVLEGADGSGKSTQFQLLRERLARERVSFATLKFPQYGTPSGTLVEAYLTGKFGEKPGDVNPYAASLFYALDRWTAAPKIRQWLIQGKVVLLDRYTDSNAGHQGAKIKNPRARKKFIDWLYDIEYGLLGVPKPDAVIILHAPTLFFDGTEEKDIHERDKKYLSTVQKMYIGLARERRKTHSLVNCGTKKRPLPPEKIHNRIWRILYKRKFVS